MNHVDSGRALACWAKLLRSWVQIQLGTGLFSSLLSPISSASLIQAPHGGATLLIFLLNIISHADWGQASLMRTDWATKLMSHLFFSNLSRCRCSTRAWSRPAKFSFRPKSTTSASAAVSGFSKTRWPSPTCGSSPPSSPTKKASPGKSFLFRELELAFDLCCFVPTIYRFLILSFSCIKFQQHDVWRLIIWYWN